MRTLFVFDAHIIRQDPWFASKFVTELFRTLQLYASDANLWNGIVPKMLLTKFVPASPSQHVLRLPIGAERALRAFNVPWDENAIMAWRDMMLGRGVVAEIYRDVLQYFISTHGIECFVYWGTNRTIKDFCDSVGVRSVAMELGPTRVPFCETRYCDFAGVNGDAHTVELDWRKFDPKDLDKWRKTIGICYADGAREDAMRRPLTSRNAYRLYRTDKPVALIAMQLDDDSNRIVHSKYSGMFDMIKDVVPKLVSAGWLVLVKPHPGAAPERNKSGARKINVQGHEDSRAFIEENFSEDEVAWLDDVPPAEYLSLLSKVDAVVSINSSMGFEAMLADKVVVALGNAPYNIGGGLPKIDDLVNCTIDMHAYRDYSRRVCSVLLDYYLQPSNLLSSPLAMSNSIRRNLVLADAYKQSGVQGLSEAVKLNPVGLIC